MTSERNHTPKSPADVWLSKIFPLRHLLCAEIGTDLRARTPTPVEVADKSFFGNLVELAIGLSLCDQPPYLHLFELLGVDRTGRLLRRAGYQTAPRPQTSGHDSRRDSGVAPVPANVFFTAYRLAQVHQLLNPRWCNRPDPDVIARILRRHPDALPRHGGETSVEWDAFAELWTSYSGGFHTALRSYGPATAQVPLLGGLRNADFLVGPTVLEVKSGRLDHDSYIGQLINQMIGYGLLAHFDGHPVTHVAVYAVRYQRLMRFPLQPLLERIAGGRADLNRLSAEFADVVRARDTAP